MPGVFLRNNFVNKEIYGNLYIIFGIFLLRIWKLISNPTLRITVSPLAL
jgi:hypothetical protein